MLISCKLAKTARKAILLRTTAPEITDISHSFYARVLHMRNRARGCTILKISFSAIECDSHVVRCVFVRWVESHSVLKTFNLFLHV